jgi:hypothetical protein
VFRVSIPTIFFCLWWKQKEVHMFLLGKKKNLLPEIRKKGCTFNLLTFKKKWKEKVEADIMIIKNVIFNPWFKQQIQSYYRDLVHFFYLPSLTFLAIFSYFFLLSILELQILILYREFESSFWTVHKPRSIMQFLKMMLL